MEAKEISKKKISIFSFIGLFVVSIIWGSTFTANKIALEILTPLSLMAVRFVIAFVIMLIIFRKKFIDIKVKNCIGGMLCGLCLFVAFILQTYGLLYTDAGKQAFLSGAYVIVVPFLTWMIYKKRPQFKTYLGSVLCFYGISLLSLNQNMSLSLGDSLTLISSAFYAGHIVITGYYVEKDDPAVLSTIQFGVMGVLSFLIVLITKDNSSINIFNDILSFESISVLYLALFGTVTAYYLQILCQKHISTTTTSIILSIEAVFGALIAVVVLKDVFTIKMILGAVLILIAIIISELDIPILSIFKATKTEIGNNE